MHKKILLMLLGVLLMFITGCATTPAENGNATGGDVSVALNEHIVEDIVARGYLLVGCKMDVPDLGYYDEATDTWSGLEVELAYKTAAGIFGVSPEEAKEQGLVHFVGVTVADREEVLEAGDIDCMMATYTITEERAERFSFSDSYYTDYIGLMVVNAGDDVNSLGSKDIDSVADLDGCYVGVPRKATTRDAFIEYIGAMNSETVSPIFCEYESYDILFQALKDGNIDAMAVDVSILNGYVDDSTKILNTRFGGQHYGAAVCHENALLLEYVNSAIAE